MMRCDRYGAESSTGLNMIHGNVGGVGREEKGREKLMLKL